MPPYNCASLLHLIFWSKSYMWHIRTGVQAVFLKSLLGTDNFLEKHLLHNCSLNSPHGVVESGEKPLKTPIWIPLPLALLPYLQQRCSLLGGRHSCFVSSCWHSGLQVLNKRILLPAAPQTGAVINGSSSPCNATCRKHEYLVILWFSMYGVFHLEHRLVLFT